MKNTKRAEMLRTAYENARENMWCEHVEAGRPAVGSGHRFVEPDDRTIENVHHQVVCMWDNLMTEARWDPKPAAWFRKQPAPTIEEVKALHWGKK